METQEKNTPCYIQNHDNKSIETTLNIGENVIKIKQRRLTGGEAKEHENDLKNIYTDKDVYMTVLKQNEFEKKLERAKKNAKKGEKIDVPIDDETKYLLYRGRIAIESHNRNVQARFIGYSCNKSTLEGGYFLLNDKEVSFDKKIEIINELGEDEETGEDLFQLLYTNANKLTYPTQKEKEDAKS